MSRKIYSVQFTTYEDDYKHRYDNGVYPEKPCLFSTKKKANEFINRELCERIFEGINDNEEEIDEDLKEYLNDKQELKKEYRNNRQVLNKFYKKYCKGEFVDYYFDWSLKECEKYC